MKDRDLIRMALYDAAQWQDSLAESFRGCTGEFERNEYKTAISLAEKYRALRGRKYTTRKSP